MPHSKQRLDPKAVFRALTDDATFATVLQAICLIAWGEEIYHIDILELRMRISEEFHAELTDQNENKLSAILLATSTNIFYERPDVFQSICETLTEGSPGIGLTTELTLLEVLAAIYEVELNHGEHPFQTPVQRLIQATVEAEAAEDGMDSIFAGLTEFREELSRQLRAVGIAHPDLPPVDDPAVK